MVESISKPGSPKWVIKCPVKIWTVEIGIICPVIWRIPIVIIEWIPIKRISPHRSIKSIVSKAPITVKGIPIIGIIVIIIISISAVIISGILIGISVAVSIIVTGITSFIPNVIDSITPG
jgi:hypothetical protein